MRFQTFFTKQRYVILGAGTIVFIVFIILAHVFGDNSEAGILFIDLAGSAITIMATALVIELLHFLEEFNRTHEVADIAEGEIQALCYRIKLAVVKIYGFEENLTERNKIAGLKDASTYLDTTSHDIETFYKTISETARPDNIAKVNEFKMRTADLQTEIEQIITLFDYSLPFSLRARILSLRASLQVAERILGYSDTSKKVTEQTAALAHELAESLYESAENVLRHGSRTQSDKQLQTKQRRIGKSIRK